VNILLLAMPDTISALDAVMRMPNLGLCSIAGNLEGHRVRIADLAFRRRGLGRCLERLLAEQEPELIGLSAMSFQFASACSVAQICRAVRPEARIALGGYHASLMYQEIASSPQAALFDFLVRGEGELTFQRLVQALEGGGNGVERIPGLSLREGESFRHNPASALSDLETLKLPDRDGRLLGEGRLLGLAFDCAETSRGCTLGCRFCSITRMYGKAIRLFSLERVLEDLRRIKARGSRGVFFVDDNITLKVERLKELARLIVRHGLNDLDYLIQASVRGIASDPELAPLLARAGFRWVFLGIESGLPRNLKDLGKGGGPDDARRAVRALREQGIGVFGGFIVGNPDDTREDIRRTFRYALELGVDQPMFQTLTPYPKTATREQLLAEGLVINPDDFSRYNGFTCNVRTRHLSSRQLTRALFWEGLRLYFHPRYLAGSRFWRYRPALWPALVANNFRYLAGAARGTIFASRHRW
jgi:anaerobic magnesium-protoporphyrin IX monomethyl ester cyclase